MSTDLDELVSSFKQVHAGARGQDLHMMRESLFHTLSSHALGPGAAPAAPSSVPPDLAGSRLAEALSAGLARRSPGCAAALSRSASQQPPPPSTPSSGQAAHVDPHAPGAAAPSSTPSKEVPAPQS